MRNRLRNRYVVAAGILLLLIAVIGTVTALYARQHQAPTAVWLPISEVLSGAEQGRWAEVFLEGNVLTLYDHQGNRFQSTKEEGAPISETLRQGGARVTVAGPVRAGPGAAVFLLLVPVGILGVGIWLSRRGGLPHQSLSGDGGRKHQESDGHPLITFGDVAGVEEAKQELAEVVEFLKAPQRFREIGASIPKGVLLIGPPGTGKTLLAKAVAGEAKVPFFSASASQFVEMFVGVGAARVRRLFQKAKKQAPAIVFIDEIDAVGRHRGYNLNGGNDEREQTLNQLLVEMDGFDSNTGVVVIAATNRPDILDNALLRPGRFDRRVTLDAPDVEGRKQILQVHARGKRLSRDADLDAIARQTPGFSGADLANALNEAAILAVRRGRTDVTQQDLTESVLRVMAGPEQRSRWISPQEKAVIAYHEAGHALCMHAVPHSDPVRMVSVIARGRALGLTLQHPDHDRHLMTREQLEARMVAAMGGRVAEELTFGTVTTGTAQDIQQATAIARRMVTEFGMSDLGVMHMAGSAGGVGYAGMGSPAAFGAERLSGPLAAAVDEAVQALVQRALERAHATLTERRADLVALAEHLQVTETVDAAALVSLLGPAAAAAGGPGSVPTVPAAASRLLAAPKDTTPRWRRLARPVVRVVRGSRSVIGLLRPARTAVPRRHLRAAA